MRHGSWWLAASLVLACAREEGSSAANRDAPAEREPSDEATPAERTKGTEPARPKGTDPTRTERAPTLEPGPARDVELEASDGTVVHGRLYPLTGGPSPIVLLFHQAGSNAGEYEPIAPRLQALGFAALAIDQRSGGKRFGRGNRTVQARGGESTGFSAAYPDLEAALAWARDQGHPHVLAWGSSYTAALVFRLGVEHGDELTALLAFSPGEYLGRKGMVTEWATQCSSLPIFVTSAASEAAEVEAIAKAAKATWYVPAKGVHGSSILRPDRNPAGDEEVWSEVEGFLGRMPTR